MERRVEFNAAGLLFDPADKPLARLHARKLDPDNPIQVYLGRQLDRATVRREIPELRGAGFFRSSPNAYLSLKGYTD